MSWSVSPVAWKDREGRVGGHYISYYDMIVCTHISPPPGRRLVTLTMYRCLHKPSPAMNEQKPQNETLGIHLADNISLLFLLSFRKLINKKKGRKQQQK